MFVSVSERLRAERQHKVLIRVFRYMYKYLDDRVSYVHYIWELFNWIRLCLNTNVTSHTQTKVLKNAKYHNKNTISEPCTLIYLYIAIQCVCDIVTEYIFSLTGFVQRV